MKCPNCQTELEVTEKKWGTDSFFGDWMASEIIWWIFIVPLYMVGIIGWIIIAMIIVAITSSTRGKYLHKCKKCGYFDIVETNQNGS
jgi:hypothetical protein